MKNGLCLGGIVARQKYFKEGHEVSRCDLLRSGGEPPERLTLG